MSEVKSSTEGRFTRRAVLTAACAAGAAIVAGGAGAQQTPRVKGPRVWLDMDQKEIDDAYDQSVWAPNQKHLNARRDAANKRALARIGLPERAAYGSTEVEKLDIYRTKQANAPINVFIHGGAWRGGSARASAYQAEMYIAAGAHYVSLDFISVLKAGGN
ncbi:MAG: hypothetical protein HYY83_07335, partial [Deltaproteobacteria bacterium]|nr:hypothetical protein [Deltaproteobacteria bacterium]